MVGWYCCASKTWLVAKLGKGEQACILFEDTGVAVVVEGKRQLGAVLGSHLFAENYARYKVSKDVKHQASIANTQLHAAYAEFIHGLPENWT